MLRNILQKHSSTILTVLGITGMVTTVGLAIKATPKATEVIKKDIEENHSDKPEEFTKLDAFKSTWKYYIPTMAVGGATIICVIGISGLNRKYQASLISAYGLLDQSYQKYRNAAKTVYGEEADDTIMAEVAKETYVYDSGSGGFIFDPAKDKSDEILFYDHYSERYFNSTMAAVINAEYHVNRNLSLGAFVTPNDFYEFLGISEIEGGDEVGWYQTTLYEGGYSWLDFEHHFTELEDGMECYVIYTAFNPSTHEEE